MEPTSRSSSSASSIPDPGLDRILQDAGISHQYNDSCSGQELKTTCSKSTLRLSWRQLLNGPERKFETDSRSSSQEPEKDSCSGIPEASGCLNEAGSS